MQSKPKVIVIAGPTASGKTALSIELAKAINGEIISADSMQIYKEMNIGTAKPSLEEQDGIKHYLLDFLSPEERFSVSQFKKLAEQYIETILKKGKTPIVVGGTGLYIDSLINGIEFGEMKVDLNYRKQLEKQVEEEGLDKFYNRAKEIDPEAIKSISQNDKKRILRILEIYNETGKTKTEQEIESRKNETKYDYHTFILQMERSILYDRINKRVDKMIEEGLVNEVQQICNKHSHFPTAMQGIGYKEVVKYLKNEITEDEMIDTIKQETRKYAKRQITWFKRNKSAIKIDAINSIQNNIKVILEECSETEKEKKE